MTPKKSSIATSIAPWLTVSNASSAAAFYKKAFGATESYRLETPDGLIVRLAIDTAEFWLSGGLTGDDKGMQQVGGETIRLILTVEDPDSVFMQALAAGASEVFPVAESHGWRIGRLIDPFGLHWEVGHQVG